jgi:predicted DNA-binding protein (MmcQ/YjbR family)
MIFMQTYRQQIYEYIKETYSASPEYLWMRYPDYAVFRHTGNQKWFCAVMDVPRDKLGLTGTKRTDILNVKMHDAVEADFLKQQLGYLRSYHMGGACWVSVLLDGTVPLPEICVRIDESFRNTAAKQ